MGSLCSLSLSVPASMHTARHCEGGMPAQAVHSSHLETARGIAWDPRSPRPNTFSPVSVREWEFQAQHLIFIVTTKPRSTQKPIVMR